MSTAVMTPDSDAQLCRLADLLRSARLNQLYYGQRLQRCQSWSFWMDAALAIGTSGAVGSFALWSTAPGSIAWQSIVAAVAILTVLKPLFGLPKAIERYAGLFGHYSSLYYELKSLHADVRTAHEFDESARRILERAEAGYRALSPEDDPSYSTKVVGALADRVNQELPPEHLWVQFQ